MDGKEESSLRHQVVPNDVAVNRSLPQMVNVCVLTVLRMQEDSMCKVYTSSVYGTKAGGGLAKGLEELPTQSYTK
jgi:hypothetical protein